MHCSGNSYINPILEPSIGGMNAEEFTTLLNERANHSALHGLDWTPPAYDVVWAAALALNLTVDKMKQRGTSISFETILEENEEQKVVTFIW